jgi:hypothetical protein
MEIALAVVLHRVVCVVPGETLCGAGAAEACRASRSPPSGRRCQRSRLP